MTTFNPVTAPIKLNFLLALNADSLPRDKSQSKLLHEPNYRRSHTDPMTGNVIENLADHPFLMDGDLTIPFESEKTREAYRLLPINHPNLRLPYPASINDDRGG